jgi:hypothetical protein
MTSLYIPYLDNTVPLASGHVTAADIVRLGDGGFAAAYVDPTSTERILLQEFDEDGAPTGRDVFVFLPSGFNRAYGLDLLENPDGGFTLSYTAQNTNTGAQTLFATNYSENLFLQPTLSDLGAISFPQKTADSIMLSTGLRAFAIEQTSTIASSIAVNITGPLNNTLTRIQIPVTPTDLRQTQLVELTNGQVVVVYTIASGASVTTNYAIIDPLDVTATPQQGVVPHTGGALTGAMAAIATPAGGFIVYGFDDSPSARLRATEFDSAGSVVGSTVVDPDQRNSQPEWIEIVTYDDGTYRLIWADDSVDGAGVSDPADGHLYSIHFNADGSARSGTVDHFLLDGEPGNIAPTAEDAYAFAAYGEHGFVATLTEASTTLHNNAIGLFSVQFFGAGTDLDDYETIWNGTDFDGKRGNDFIIGTDVANMIRGGDGQDVIRGMGGDDLIFMDDHTASSESNVYIDRAWGGDGNDRIENTFGSSWQDGGAGRDVLLGGTGSDSMVGGAGGDVLRGRSGDDSMAGNGARDILTGGAGHDTLDGGDGDDTLRGSSGEDLMFGGRNNDLIIGGTGDDTIFGGAGRDVITGRSGADVMTGGAGQDVFVFDRFETNLYNSDNDALFEDHITDFELDRDVIRFTSGSGVSTINDLTITHADGVAEIAWDGGFVIVTILTETGSLSASDFEFV